MQGGAIHNLEAAVKATILDLRYRMKDVLKALERNEAVDILCDGKPKGVITAKRGARRGAVADHPFFGMRKRGRSVDREMDRLRGGRQMA
jgi:hypothetical protein